MTTLAATVGLWKWFGQKWVEQRLAVRLEKFKTEQQKELERLRHLLSSRVSKIHDKEFEVLPEAWRKLHELYGWILHALDLTFKPVLRDMTDEDLEEFMRTAPASHLSESQKETLRKSSDRAHSYNEMKLSNDMDTAKDKQRQFTNYLIENRIFMTEDLRAKFAAVQDAFISALTSYEIGKLQGLVDEVERAIRTAFATMRLNQPLPFPAPPSKSSYTRILL